ncbi:hypothetical protein F8S13_02165 [Chloroflexia bacterium SDU3-3]|nr:hypothetical protein F8S13_02165 [Chloroflexia bacterium SDU3-3]
MHRSWIWTIGIDATVTLSFLAFLIAQTLSTGDTDIEKVIILGIAPAALGVNVALLVGLLAILQQRRPRTLRTLLLAAVAWLAAYPSFFLGAQLSTALRFNHATQEAAELWVFFLVPWVVTLIIGAAGARWAMGEQRQQAAA